MVKNNRNRLTAEEIYQACLKLNIEEMEAVMKKLIKRISLTYR